LPGNFFLVAGQKKGSINHCYLSVTIEQSACAPAAFVSRHDPVCGIALILKRPAGGAMADNEQAAEGAAAEATEAGAPSKGKLKLIIAIVAALAVLGGGAATYFMFFKHSGEEMHAEALPPKPPVFVDVPDMMVNLANAPGERVQYLKVKLMLEVREEKQVEAIKPSMPRVTDIFQTYLRELRPTDLNGSAGLFRLKEELTRRVNVALAPIPVNAVLFKEVVIQ
jgi:flagellar protein FliL